MNNWKSKAVAATRGTQLGAIVQCALDWHQQIPAPTPRFTSKATITSDGFVMADFVDRNGEDHLGAFVGDVSDLATNARGLAKHLELNDEERGELFATFKNWIATDYSGKGLGL